MGRLSVWLFHLFSRIAVLPPDDPLPRPTPGEIMAVRVLIPTESSRTPGEQICIAMFRLGYRKRVSEEKSPFPLAPQPGGTTAVFVDKAAQAQVQREMIQSDLTHLGMRSRAMTRELQEHPGLLKTHHARMLQQKDITHKLDHTPTETLPNVKPPHKLQLTHDTGEAAPPQGQAAPRKSFQTRKLAALPEPTPIAIEFSEDEDDAGWLNDTTTKRKAV